MIILSDTREQLPYTFETPSEVGTLQIAVYSIAGLQDLVAVERKELNDLISCLSVGRDALSGNSSRAGRLITCALSWRLPWMTLYGIATGRRCRPRQRFRVLSPSL